MTGLMGYLSDYVYVKTVELWLWRTTPCLFNSTSVLLTRTAFIESLRRLGNYGERAKTGLCVPTELHSQSSCNAYDADGVEVQGEFRFH